MGVARSSSRTPEDFIAGQLEGVEAVVVRIGQSDAKLVLVDAEGRWDHWVYHDIDECRAKAMALGIAEIAVGEFPDKTRVRMNACRRRRESYDAGAYAETGAIGPVIPYPENRPRRREPLSEEAPPKRGQEPG